MRRKRLLQILIPAATAAVCAVVLLGYLFARQSCQTQTIAIISLRGQVVRTVDLSKVTKTETFTLGEPGAQNTIEISPRGIAVISADCRDQICVHQGIRSHGPEPIVCLPHQLSIRFSSPDGAASGVDAVTGR